MTHSGAVPTTFSWRALLLTGLAMAALLAACGDDPTEPATNPPPDPQPEPRPAAVAIAPGNTHLEVGDTLAFSAVVEDSTGATLTDATVLWSLSDSSVAGLQGTTVTATAAGGTWVRAAVDGAPEVSDSAWVGITEPPTPTIVTLFPSSVTVTALGDSIAAAARTDSVPEADVQVIVFDQDGRIMDVPVTWSVSDTAALALGPATENGTRWIEARTTAGGMLTATAGAVADTIPIVMNQQADSIRLLRSVDTVAVGSTEHIAHVVLDARGNVMEDADVIWNSSRGLIAPVDSNGWVTGRREGTATITATSGLASASVEYHVVPTPASALEKVAGDGLESSPGYPVVPYPRVRVLDADGEPYTGANVAWTVRSGGGSVSVDTAATGLSGEAQTVWQLGEVGSQELEARVGEMVVIFTATAVAPTIDTIGRRAAIPDSAEAGSQVWVQMDVRDTFGHRIDTAGVPVVVTASDGGQPQGAAYDTDAEGVIELWWTLGPTVGTQTLSAELASEATVRGELTIEATPAPATALTLSPEAPLLEAIEARDTLVAAGTDAVGNPATLEQPVTWASSDPSVATVTDGIVEAVSEGLTWVTATSGALSDSVEVRVHQNAVDVRLGRPAYPVPDAFERLESLHQSFTTYVHFLDANGYPVNGRELSIEMALTEPGSLTATPVGTGVVNLPPVAEYHIVEIESQDVTPVWATIVFRAAGRGADGADTLEVYVYQTARSVEASRDSLALEVGWEETLTTTVTDSLGYAVDNATVHWQTADPSIANTISYGNGRVDVRGIAPGTTFLTVSSGPDEDTVWVTVAPTTTALVFPHIDDGTGISAAKVQTTGTLPTWRFLDAAGSEIASVQDSMWQWSMPDVPAGTQRSVVLEVDDPTAVTGGLWLNFHVTALPETLRGLTRLSALYASGEPMDGQTLPTWLGDLWLKTVQIIDSGLAGSIPGSLFDAYLQSLQLSDNALDGTLPDVSGAPNLIELQLSGNALTGYTGGLDAIGAYTYVNLTGSNLDAATVDRILVDIAASVAAWPRSGALFLEDDYDLGMAAPTAASLDARNALEAAGWDVFVDSP